MLTLKTETIYNLLNDFNEKDIDCVACDVEMIKRQAPFAGYVHFDKKISDFKLSVSNYYIKSKVTGQVTFLFQKRTQHWFRNGLLNKKIIYFNVPYTA